MFSNKASILVSVNDVVWPLVTVPLNFVRTLAVLLQSLSFLQTVGEWKFMFDFSFKVLILIISFFLISVSLLLEFWRVFDFLVCEIFLIIIPFLVFERVLFSLGVSSCFKHKIWLNWSSILFKLRLSTFFWAWLK